MIETINKAIEAKLKSKSWTNVVKGVVTNLDPLKIRISDRIEIGLEFIEPASLGINDMSPIPAQYPFVIGDKVNLIRYNNGQRFYILGASTAPVESAYLNTNNSTSLSINTEEEIKGTISLHKVAKTGSYDDLNNKPSFSNYVTLSGAQTISGKKTFNTLPESSVVPTGVNQLVNKKYVDDNILYYDILETF